jgi:hypothetical protein
MLRGFECRPANNCSRPQRGQLTGWLTDPPLLCEATLTRDDEVLIRGSLSSVRLGATAQLTVET